MLVGWGKVLPNNNQRIPKKPQDPAMITVDGALHAIVEQNPDASLKKFIKYNVPKLIQSLTKKPKKTLHCSIGLTMNALFFSF
jgi:hypothetical protein